jgi:hypothetical protein
MASIKPAVALETAPFAAGRRLREIRDRLGMTLRSVEESSTRLANLYNNPEFILPPSRLSDIETKGVLPSLYRLHSLSVVYKIEWKEMLRWYGIDVGLVPTHVNLPPVPKTHLMTNQPGLEDLQLPVRMDPGADRIKTMDIARFIQQWGLLPMTYLAKFANDNFVYGYIGCDDYTMYPVLPPGSFVQVDQSKNKITKSLGRSDWERPIYFIETHDEYICGWCTLREGKLIVQPHPMSPCEIKLFKVPQEAEIIGQVVGAAIRMGVVRPPGNAVEPAKF